MIIRREHNSMNTVIPGEAINSFCDGSISLGALGVLAVIESGCLGDQLSADKVSQCGHAPIELVRVWLDELGRANLVDMAEGSA